MGYVYFDDTLDFISKVTKFLNQTVPGCTVDGIGLEVKLVDWNSGKAEVIGEWSDEISADNWSYEEKWNPDA